jgi:phage virion morphogenesis protein
MSDADLTLLEDWVDGLLLAISPTGRRRIAQSVAAALRRSQQQRITDQRNPDGTPYVPRKVHKQRSKAGRIKRGKMFVKLRTAKYLKAHGTSESAVVEITGHTARIARVHQYGMTDQVTARGPRVRYAVRKILGLSSEDCGLVHDALVKHLRR